MAASTGWHRLFAAGSLVGLVGLSYALLRPLQAEPRPTVPVTAQADEAEDVPEFRGAETCAICHNQGATPNPLLARDFCVLDEMATFFDDKHSKAYENLTGPVGQQMSERLEYDVTEARECLSCHANWTADQPQKPATFEYGVTCESCHGPSSLWVDPHYKQDWRKLPLAEKQKLGFVDVRDPVDRARQCLSCHVGNRSQGKILTHAMYAAGHPPLPGFEIETFASHMPPHWRSLREKGDFRFRKEFIEQTCQGFAEHVTSDLPRTRSVVIGGVMVLRESLNLVGEMARAETERNGDANDAWPDFAMFDCQACHHDLRNPAWRQLPRHGPAVPGRPRLLAWPTALIPVAIRHAAGNANERERLLNEFTAFRAQLNHTLSNQPFGNSEELAALILDESEWRDWLDNLAGRLRTASYDREAAQRLLKDLLTLPPDEYPDYHSARQIAWAISAIHSELHATYPEFPAAPAQETRKQRSDRDAHDLEILRKWETDVRDASRQATRELLTEVGLQQHLRLRLPAGANADIMKELSESLDTVTQYNPEAFRRMLNVLSERLSRE